MTTSEKVCELINKVKKAKLPQGAFKPEADLRDDLGLDSLALAELLVLAEEAFKISISDEAALNAKTLGEIITYVDNSCAA